MALERWSDLDAGRQSLLARNLMLFAGSKLSLGSAVVVLGFLVMALARKKIKRAIEQVLGVPSLLDGRKRLGGLLRQAQGVQAKENKHIAALRGIAGDARVVLLGEATHGTSEFYHARAAITRYLIERRGFNIVAVEADWPDAARVDAYVRHLQARPGREQAFTRFPRGCGAMPSSRHSRSGCVLTITTCRSRIACRSEAWISPVCKLRSRRCLDISIGTIQSRRRVRDSVNSRPGCGWRKQPP